MAFKIGDLEIKKRVILAPMAGITSFSYRKFMNKFGCGATYTEMISDCGLIYDNKRTISMIESDGSDRPLGIQLFGGSKETLLKGVEIIENLSVDFDFIDLNFACPVPKVTKNNGGSKRLTDPEKLYDCVSEIVKKAKHPVTAKIRLGYDKINVVEVAQTLERAGIKFLAIHARTRTELYSGKPHFEELKDFHQFIKIPFAISGNIFTVKDALNALEITGADAVLVARGGEGNPKLVRNINLALEGKEYDESQNFDEQYAFLKEFITLLVEEKGEQRATSILKGIAPKFFNYDFPYIKELKRDLTQNANNIDEIYKCIDNYKAKYLS